MSLAFLPRDSHWVDICSCRTHEQANWAHAESKALLWAIRKGIEGKGVDQACVMGGESEGGEGHAKKQI